MSFREKSLGAIVLEIPQATTVLRKYNLDYCCGGKKSLRDACSEKGLSADEILNELSALTPEIRFRPDELAPAGITAYIIRRYHEDLRVRMPELCLLAEKVEKAHAGAKELPPGLALLLNEMMNDLFSHMDKEEQVLFPLIERGQLNFVKAPINRMEFEHEQHGENLQRLRTLTNNFTPPENACVTWKALYQGLSALEGELMDHINLENNVLFPRALNSLVP